MVVQLNDTETQEEEEEETWMAMYIMSFVWGTLSSKVCETLKQRYLVDMKSPLGLEVKGKQDCKGFWESSGYIWYMWEGEGEGEREEEGKEEEKEKKEEEKEKKSWGWNNHGHQRLPAEEELELAMGSGNEPLKKQKVIAQKMREELQEGGSNPSCWRQQSGLRCSQWLWQEPILWWEQFWLCQVTRSQFSNVEGSQRGRECATCLPFVLPDPAPPLTFTALLASLDLQYRQGPRPRPTTLLSLANGEPWEEEGGWPGSAAVAQSEYTAFSRWVQGTTPSCLLAGVRAVTAPPCPIWGFLPPLVFLCLLPTPL